MSEEEEPKGTDGTFTEESLKGAINEDYPDDESRELVDIDGDKDEEDREPDAKEEEEEEGEGEELGQGTESDYEMDLDLDWEREAKKKVRIELEEPIERRRTIYDLESYMDSAGPSVNDLLKLSETDVVAPPRRIRYSVSMGMPGIARVNLSPLTQKIIGCVIGENVTTEYPWVYVNKETIEDNIDLHEESSDFLPMRDEIHRYPDPRILIGYAPSLTDDAQFYICLTEEGRDAVVRHIRAKREEHEGRVRNAVYKPIGDWSEMGTGTEIDQQFARNTRPLLEIEVVSTADFLNTPMNLVDRTSSDQRDGYVELVPYREQFENVYRTVQGRATQVTPAKMANDAQTSESVPENSWFQYRYEYRPIDASRLDEERKELLKIFLQRYRDEICDQAQQNATWDIYANDYRNLVRNERDVQPPVTIGYKEHQSYHDRKYITDRLINDLSWHPLWTGIAFASYSSHAKSEYLTGPKAYNEVSRACQVSNYVLVWSFSDCLTSKLALECPREVTAVAVCPLDGTVIVGGCANGQVAIWHIPGKIEQVEAVPASNSARVKYRIVMKSLTKWMRDVVESSVVRPAAMSSLKNGQTGAITQIVWVSPHYKVEKSGRLSSLPEETPLEDLNWQFMTASEDGTIAFWDLKWRPTKREDRSAKRKEQTATPSEMSRTTSPFKALDRVFQPDYLLVVQYPDEGRRPVITTITMYNPKLAREQTEPYQPAKDAITVRRYFRPIVALPETPPRPEILVGTVEGDFGCVTWEGFEFTTDLTVNREVCKWAWIKAGLHDGPVTHCVRSKYYWNIVATVGGKVFAIWREDSPEPVLWKRTSVGYTACAWGSFRPTVLILARMDGTVEIWDLIVKSREPAFSQSLSGRIITGIYTHELYMDPQCVGFCDFNGVLRVFLAPGVFLTYDEADILWMKNFIDRQVDRISEFKGWQRAWNEENPRTGGSRREVTERRFDLEDALDRRTGQDDLEAKVKTATLKSPWQFIEEARERWRSMELMRMQRVILEKKGLRREELERQRAPILRMRQEARRKKRKIREILGLQDRIFEETVAFLFPDALPETKRPSVVGREPEVDDTPAPTTEKTETILLREVQERFVDPDEDMIYNFMEVQAEALAALRSKPFRPTFDWRKVLTEGRWRRGTMDLELKRIGRRTKKFSVDQSSAYRTR